MDPLIADMLQQTERRLPSYRAAQMPPYLILISGLPGAGKSTVAWAIARSLSATLVESDFVRKQLFATPTYTQAESEQTHATCRTLIGIKLRQGHHTVYDATNLKEQHRQLALAIAHACGARFAIVQVVADEATIRERLMQRKAHVHFAPMTYSDADWDVYLMLKREAEPIAMPHFVVNTVGVWERALQEVLQRL